MWLVLFHDGFMRSMAYKCETCGSTKRLVHAPMVPPTCHGPMKPMRPLSTLGTKATNTDAPRTLRQFGFRS